MDVDTLRDRLGQWFKPYAALWITLLVGGTLVIIMALLGAEVYGDVVDEQGLASLDLPALQLSQDLRNPALDTAVTAFTNIGGGIGMPILASILTAWLTFLSRTWRPIILVGGAAAVSTFATTVGKRLVGRSPPGPLRSRPAVRDPRPPSPAATPSTPRW